MTLFHSTATVGTESSYYSSRTVRGDSDTESVGSYTSAATITGPGGEAGREEGGVCREEREARVEQWCGATGYTRPVELAGSETSSAAQSPEEVEAVEAEQEAGLADRLTARLGRLLLGRHPSSVLQAVITGYEVVAGGYTVYKLRVSQTDLAPQPTWHLHR